MIHAVDDVAFTGFESSCHNAGRAIHPYGIHQMRQQISRLSESGRKHYHRYMPLRTIEWVNDHVRDPYTADERDHQFIFVHVPKTAGISICKALGIRNHGHFTVAAYVRRSPETFDRFFKAAFVRNPWDRARSAYLHLSAGGSNPLDERAGRELIGGRDFESFIQALQRAGPRRRILSWRHFRPQLDYILDPRTRASGVDFLGRHERLPADYAALVSSLRLAHAAELPHENQGSDAERPEYSPRGVEIIRSVYAGDIEHLGYADDPPDAW